MAFQEMSTQRIVEEGRKEHEEQADAVYAQEITHAPFGEPRCLLHELHALGLFVETEEEGQGDAELDDGEDEGEDLDEKLVLSAHEEEQHCAEEGNKSACLGSES